MLKAAECDSHVPQLVPVYHGAVQTWNEAFPDCVFLDFQEASDIVLCELLYYKLQKFVPTWLQNCITNGMERVVGNGASSHESEVA